MKFQVPLPSGDVWVQFSVVSVIVLCIALLGVGSFFLIRWVWGEYKKIRAEDLAWRENQNKLREEAVAEQNRLWREAMAARDAQIGQRDARYEQYERERNVSILKISTVLESVATDLKAHDEQAKTILHTVNRVDENTRPLPGQTGYERRKSD